MVALVVLVGDREAGGPESKTVMPSLPITRPTTRPVTRPATTRIAEPETAAPPTR